MQTSATQPIVAPTIIAILVVVVALLLLLLSERSVEAAVGPDWVAVRDGEVSVAVVAEVSCGVGGGLAAVLGETQGVVVVKALYSSVLAGLSAQAK